MTPFETIIRTVTAQWRASKGLPPLASDMELPACIVDPDEAKTWGPFKRERDEPEPDRYAEDTSDWPDDHKLDDPRRGQAKYINGER